MTRFLIQASHVVQIISGLVAGMAGASGRWDMGCYFLLLYLAIHFTAPGLERQLRG